MNEKFEMISEENARLVLDVLKNLKPAYGYKKKHKNAVSAIKEIVWTFDWEKHQKECDDFLKEFRAMQASKAAL